MATRILPRAAQPCSVVPSVKDRYGSADQRVRWTPAGPALIVATSRDMAYCRYGLLSPWHASPGLNTLGSVSPPIGLGWCNLTSCPNDWTMKSVGPLTKSFSPENEQIELACDTSLCVPG